MRYRKEKHHYLVVLDRGDEIVQSLTGLCASGAVRGGIVRGIGGVTDVVLGFFDLRKKEYLRGEFKELYELAALTGDVSLVDGKPFCHLHAVISDSHMQAFAGHLFQAKVSITAEIFVTPGDGVERKFNGETGLNLLEL